MSPQIMLLWRSSDSSDLIMCFIINESLSGWLFCTDLIICQYIYLSYLHLLVIDCFYTVVFMKVNNPSSTTVLLHYIYYFLFHYICLRALKPLLKHFFQLYFQKQFGCTFQTGLMSFAGVCMSQYGPFVYECLQVLLYGNLKSCFRFS